MSVYDVDPNKLIEKAAEELKRIKEIQPASWARFVKTGTHKERSPVSKDFWYIRAASTLRTIYTRKGPIGVQKLRTKYGGRKRRGHVQEEFRKASGNIIRKILQQLEKAELIKKAEKGVYKGKIITKKGRLFLDKIAKELRR